MSFLELEGLHVFVTGAAGGIGSAIVNEFLAQGCKVTAHDLRPNPLVSTNPSLHCIQGDISSEDSIQDSIAQATAHFSQPINILCANAGITDESSSYPIWDMPSSLWDRTYAVNVRGTFLTIKHFLKSIETAQLATGEEVKNVSVVVTGSECGVFGQAGHVEYASGKAGLQYGLVKTVKNEIVRLNRKARINAVAPGWVNTKLIEGRLDDPGEMWREAEATVPLRKIAQPTDVARVAAFLASHRAAGHISGQCISVDGGMEGRIVWSEDEVRKTQNTALEPEKPTTNPTGEIFGTATEGVSLASRNPSTVAIPTITSLSAPPPVSKPKPKIKILLSVDFDAVSGWLGTSQHPDNNLADYSSGFFSAYVGVPRLLKLFAKHHIADKVTWFVPMHSAESFPKEFTAIKESGAEIGLHGYCHEGAPQLTLVQERDVLEHCISLYQELLGKRPLGYRAPLYQLRESTVELLEEYSFLYDSSLAHHDSKPYFLPNLPPIDVPTYTDTTPAKNWMRPLPQPNPSTSKTLVEIPANWYTEDMTPLQFWPNTPNSQGYVDVRVVENMWRDKLEWVRNEMEDEGLAEGEMCVFPLVLHPDTSGMAHVIGMVERVIRWLKELEEEGIVEWCQYADVAGEWRERNAQEAV
ncbi:polysaccharide deacetylase [Pyrenophora tritici-repentis]|uniref:Glucose 1-dehydrogenase n=2 Tax=Pyrenophora tritici-repentis TaxID=45151 RepID=A0A2W1CWW5_9PLEO|nr:polysaccharide deacetylase [Pyrenophora tritici-repentis Pt-1C-BFP]KAA8619760.1 Glucose 1-dehydrogenase [Pyrenophora tritici-repentis]EDU46990.1 polysaccharide deacetylase [Pyrenophora tritici-repentis Pt-1C-BFP]KAF7447900.1 Glucose 1-dehydrogenase [Pyrenophora tritici-repentis]KAF7571601.1 polysaccharide deacetylase [Pyrenophora tritici-repentis]KAG9385174.1 Glucose 1-dehydrogenase [Pyrenophora tritici-repentis]